MVSRYCRRTLGALFEHSASSSPVFSVFYSATLSTTWMSSGDKLVAYLHRQLCFAVTALAIGQRHAVAIAQISTVAIVLKRDEPGNTACTGGLHHRRRSALNGIARASMEIAPLG